MKANDYLLRLSMAANAVLIATCVVLYSVWRSQPAPETDARPAGGESRESPETEAGPPAAYDFPEAGSREGDENNRDEIAFSSRVLSGMSLSEVAEHLENLGWSPEDAATFAAGRFAVDRLVAQAPPPAKTYWRDPDRERQWERSDHFREALIELGSFLGISALEPYGLKNWEIPLPPEKREAAREVERDYSKLRRDVTRNMGSIPVRHDYELLRILREERAKDLEALLSPEELFEHELRFSNDAGLRRQLDYFEPTEEEFRTIFRTRFELRREFGTTDPDTLDPEAARRFEEARAEGNRRLRESLGEDRFRQYRWRSEPNYRELNSVARRLGIPRDEIDSVYPTIQAIETQFNEMVRLPHSERDNWDEWMRDLRNETRETLRGVLGEDGFEVYRSQGRLPGRLSMD